jgi:hypothetical protein
MIPDLCGAGHQIGKSQRARRDESRFADVLTPYALVVGAGLLLGG